MAFDRIEPIGPDRIELMLGVLCALVANVNSKKGTKPFAANVFIPNYEKLALQSFVQRTELSGEDLTTKLRAFNAALGGKEVQRPCQPG